MKIIIPISSITSNKKQDLICINCSLYDFNLLSWIDNILIKLCYYKIWIANNFESRFLFIKVNLFLDKLIYLKLIFNLNHFQYSEK